MSPSPEITKLIGEWRNGDRQAEDALFTALYRKLHSIAVHCLRTEPASASLGATALVHEAYIRFTRSSDLEIRDRAHLLALSARVMHRILVDRARARHTARREGKHVDLDRSEHLIRSDREADEILMVDQAMQEFCKDYPRQGRLVELHYFAGYSIEESASIIGVSSKTARRDWNFARTRLKESIDGSAASV